MNIILFDTEDRKRLFPLTATRAVADIRMGILTIKERWEKMTGSKVFVLTDKYLQSLYETISPGDYVFVDARIFPSAELVQKIIDLPDKEPMTDDNGLIAGKASIDSLPGLKELSALFKKTSTITSVRRLTFPHEVFQWNQEMIQLDFRLVTKGRTSNSHNESVNVINSSKIFIEDGADISFTNLNASSGPIYIGKNATVMEGSFIRGPLALGEGAVLKMGSKIYGATTIGPYCTVAGEVKNSVITGYSNKGHEGYLGDSVIGEWCNLGAGTSNSNVKNTGGEVKTWNYYEDSFVAAGNKCGVIMGDYSRTSINTSINTGTIIGVCCNVFGEGLTPKLIPDFSWGAKEPRRYEFEKAIKDISNWKKMKNKIISEEETKILKHIFDNYTN